MKLPNAASFAAASKSASSITINGAFPPSSSKIGFKHDPALAASFRATPELPVKLIFFTTSCSISAFVICAASSRAWLMTFMTPGGNPASAAMEVTRKCVRGEVSDALMMTVFPQATGKKMARIRRMTGAFQGTISRITPYGSLVTYAARPIIIQLAGVPQ